MFFFGCPSDENRKNHDRSIHLHAWKLELDVPGTGKRVQLEANVPEGDALWAVAITA